MTGRQHYHVQRSKRHYTPQISFFKDRDNSVTGNLAYVQLLLHSESKGQYRKEEVSQVRLSLGGLIKRSATTPFRRVWLHTTETRNSICCWPGRADFQDNVVVSYLLTVPQCFISTALSFYNSHLIFLSLIYRLLCSQCRVNQGDCRQKWRRKQSYLHPPIHTRYPRHSIPWDPQTQLAGQQGQLWQPN